MSVFLSLRYYNLENVHDRETVGPSVAAGILPDSFTEKGVVYNQWPDIDEFGDGGLVIIRWTIESGCLEIRLSLSIKKRVLRGRSVIVQRG